MIIRLDNCWAELVAATADEAAWLYSVLSFADTSQIWEMDPVTHRMVRSTLRYPDGTPQLDERGREILKPLPRLSLLSLATNRFPAGLTGHICDCARDIFEVQLLDKRPHPGIHPQPELLDEWWAQVEDTGKEKRDYQVDAIHKALAAGRGILDLCTGAGKTLASMGIFSALPGIKWMFIVPSDSLYKQAIATYEETFPGEKAGRVRKEQFIDGDFIVTTYQTLSARLERRCPKMMALIPKITGVFVDECHGAAATTQFDGLMALENAYYRYGLSGTPLDRGDDKNKHNVGVLGRILASVKTVELVERGILAKPIITAVPVVQSGPNTRDWRDDYETFIIRSDHRMWVLMSTLLEFGEAPGVIFCNAPEHGELIEKAVSALGFRCRFIWGPSKGHERDRSYKDLKEGNIDYLIGSSILDTGIDIPCIRFMLFAGGRKGKISVTQRLGRGVRMDKDTGKFEVRIFDLFDMMDPDAPPYMLGNKNNAAHSQQRLRIFRQNGFDVQLKA